MNFTLYGTGPKGERTIDCTLNDDEMVYDQDGSFVIHVGPEKPEGAVNYMPSKPTTDDLFARQYYNDHDNEVPATYSVEPVVDPGPPPVLTEEELARRLDAAAEWVDTVCNVEVMLMALNTQATPTQLRDGQTYDSASNQEEGYNIDMSWVAKMMPTTAILYTGKSINNLGDDEALVLRCKAPKARYWSIHSQTRWMESPDYQNHQIIFTSANTQIDDDGYFTLVISHANPGVKNWLDSTGLRNMTICFRAVLCEDPELEVDWKRVSLDEAKDL